MRASQLCRKTLDHAIASGDADRVQQELVDVMIRLFAKRPEDAAKIDWFRAITRLVRGYMAECWLETRRRSSEENAKVVYYLSMEFLPGRSLKSNLINLGVDEVCRKALKNLGVEVIYFNPVFEAPSLHKYDASSYHHIDNNFGYDRDGDVAAIRSETEDPASWTFTNADSVFLDLIRQAHALASLAEKS